MGGRVAGKFGHSNGGFSNYGECSVQVNTIK